MVRKDEVAAANRQAADRARHTPIATEARYDRITDRVVKGVVLAGLKWGSVLATCKGSNMPSLTSSPKSKLHPRVSVFIFRSLDADIHLPVLLESFLGLKELDRCGYGQDWSQGINESEIPSRPA